MERDDLTGELRHNLRIDTDCLDVSRWLPKPAPSAVDELAAVVDPEAADRIAKEQVITWPRLKRFTGGFRELKAVAHRLIVVDSIAGEE